MMYMNEETKRKLNSTQTIADNMDNIIEAFVTYYGEENRERITNRFSNMIIAGHITLKQMERIINDDENEKISKLVQEFFEKIKNNPLYREDKRDEIFYASTLKYSNLQPIEAYIKAMNGENYSELYFKKFIDIFLSDRGYSKYDEISLNDRQELDKIVIAYQETMAKYNSYLKELSGYREYISKMNRFSEELDYKYRIEMIKEIREYFSEEEYYKIINSERHMINSNSKLRNVIGYQIDSKALISAFNKDNEEILMSGNDDWKTDSIKRDRIEYFKNLGIDLGDNYEDYVSSGIVSSKRPREEFVMRVERLREKYLDKKRNDFYNNFLEYTKTMEEIDRANLFDKAYGYGIETYLGSQTCIYPNVKQNGNTYQEYPVLSMSMDGLEEYLDHNLIHELNHVYEFNLLEVNDNGYLAVTGWDRLNCNINGEESDEIREYELFNEIINEMISQEITEILFNRKQYVFNDQSNAKYSGGTSYERTKFIIKEFYDRYKEEILASRRNGDLSNLTDKVGLDNFNNFNSLFAKFYEYFPGFSLVSAFDDYKQEKDTDLSRKLKEILDEKNKILSLMSEYKKEEKSK